MEEIALSFGDSVISTAYLPSDGVIEEQTSAPPTRKKI